MSNFSKKSKHCKIPLIFVCFFYTKIGQKRIPHTPGALELKTTFFLCYISNTRNTYDISITEPYFNNKKLSLTGGLYSSFTDPASVNYETEDLGLAFKAQFPIAQKIYLETRYSLSTVKVKADSNATIYERLLAGTDTNSMVGYTLNFDNRNSPYKPSSGFRFLICLLYTSDAADE